MRRTSALLLGLALCLLVRQSTQNLLTVHRPSSESLPTSLTEIFCVTNLFSISPASVGRTTHLVFYGRAPAAQSNTSILPAGDEIGISEISMEDVVEVYDADTLQLVQKVPISYAGIVLLLKFKSLTSSKVN